MAITSGEINKQRKRGILAIIQALHMAQKEV